MKQEAVPTAQSECEGTARLIASSFDGNVPCLANSLL